MVARSIRLALALVSVACATAGLSACGSDDESEEASGGTGGAGGSTGGTSGSGGSSSGGSSSGGSSGSSGSGGSGADSGVATTDCKGTSCSGVSVGGFAAAPCCAGAGEDKCGLDFSALPIDGGVAGCTETNQPGDPDPSCTPDAGADAGFALEGCCRPEGQCGVLINFGAVDLGCVDVSQFADGATQASCTP
jgi:hypothetical protein